MILLVFIGGFFAYRMFHPATTFAADGIDPNWDFAAQTRDVTRPSLVLFTAQWCGACQALEHGALASSQVRDELYDHYNVYTVDLTNPTQAVAMHSHKLGVSAIPTMIRYNAEGHETSRSHGQSAEDLVAWLKAGE